MKLKTYQEKVINELSDYMEAVNKSAGLKSAWKLYWDEKDVNIGYGGVPAYNNSIDGVPHVCMKVPTSGGKTFTACACLKKIFDAMPSDKPQLVVWLVPSDSILKQTIKAFSDVSHPYRQRLDMDFGGRVGIYTKEMLLNGQNFSPDTVREMLTVCIMSYDSLRIKKQNKDTRKVYQENGNLLRFAEYFKNDGILLADTPDTALIQVLRHLSPVMVVDESHNANSDLSIEMLNNLNPSFVLDLTATPRENSNIISYVNSRDLKKEHMVKLPVVVYNRNERMDVIRDAIQLRGSLEQQAIACEQKDGEYIRPIVLFQAQSNIKEDSETYDKIKEKLIAMGIPEEEIAIKTADIDDIGKTDLMSRDCPIRYIITVNALKEGWDCPFAYILASLANKTSKVDVEQILGRILRQPYAREHSSALLNTSYVLTCSNDFHNTLESIVRGLNQAGFSRKDYRIGNPEETEEPVKQKQNFSQDSFTSEQHIPYDTFEDIVPEDFSVSSDLTIEYGSDSVKTMEHTAEDAASAYEAELEGDDEGYTGGELGNMLNQYAMQPQFKKEAERLCIPQFFIKSVPNLFGDEYELLEKEHLSEGFSLTGQDAQISFELSTGEMYNVDIQEEGEAVPKYKRTSKEESEYIKEYLSRLPEEKKIKQCTDMICHQINKNNRYPASEIEDYVNRIVRNMTEDELSAMEMAVPAYAKKIQDKIESLEDTYREKQFYKWVDTGKVFCRDSYSLPLVITPANSTDAKPYSLYEAERNDLNIFEDRVIDAIIGLDNVLWWHRIIDRNQNEFRINGFLNHYPDFMVMTKSGILAMVESKGDHLDGNDSMRKLELGRTWQSLTGPSNYKYYMVYETKQIKYAYNLDDFVAMFKML